jgi:hypothetical protein
LFFVSFLFLLFFEPGGALPAWRRLAGDGGVARASAPAPRYYFQLRGVETTLPVDGGIREFVAQALHAELSARPEWQSDLGSATNRDEILSELKRRKLSGFDLVVKITELATQTKEARAASRLKRLSVTVRLEVLGTTLPGEKIAFSGEGQTGYETEVAESRVDTESQSLVKDAIRDAIKQAVDQAVLKLAAPKSFPVNESKKRRKHP